MPDSSKVKMGALGVTNLSGPQYIYQLSQSQDMRAITEDGQCKAVPVACPHN